MNNPLKYFAELRDPRVERTREHLLEEILLMVLAAVLSGAGSWNEIEGYSKAKHEWLQGFLKLPGGIPSHDTFNRVISALDPAELEKGFVTWVSSIAKLTAGEVVAIDGKALRGTHETGKQTLVHMVSAWLCFFRGGIFRFSIPSPSDDKLFICRYLSVKTSCFPDVRLNTCSVIGRLPIPVFAGHRQATLPIVWATQQHLINPDVDRGQWYELAKARKYIREEQCKLLDTLIDQLAIRHGGF